MEKFTKIINMPPTKISSNGKQKTLRLRPIAEMLSEKYSL